MFSYTRQNCYNHCEPVSHRRQRGLIVPRQLFARQQRLLLIGSSVTLVEEFIMNDKVLIISIFSLLGIGIVAVLFIAVPWLVNYALPNWKDSLLDSGIVMIAIGLFVYGFYMNTKMH